jgi:hypothetical protein
MRTSALSFVLQSLGLCMELFTTTLWPHAHLKKGASAMKTASFVWIGLTAMSLLTLTSTAPASTATLVETVRHATERFQNVEAATVATRLERSEEAYGITAPRMPTAAQSSTPST